MSRDSSIDDGPDLLGTAAIIGTAVVGTAILAYQGHQLGTELYLTYLPAQWCRHPAKPHPACHAAVAGCREPHPCR